MVRLVYLFLGILFWQIIRIYVMTDEEGTEKQIEKSICQVQQIKDSFLLENQWLLIIQFVIQQFLIIFLAANLTEFSLAMCLNVVIVVSEAFGFKQYKYRVLRRATIILHRKYSRPENKLLVLLVEENKLEVKAFSDFGYTKRFQINKLSELNEVIKYIRLITKQKNESLKKIKAIKKRWFECQEN